MKAEFTFMSSICNSHCMEQSTITNKMFILRHKTFNVRLIQRLGPSSAFTARDNWADEGNLRNFPFDKIAQP